MAGVVLGLVLVFVGFYGQEIWVEPGSSWSLLVTSLTGVPGVVDGVLVLLGSGMLAALGAVIHDLRRVADNTAPEALAERLAAALPAPGRSGRTGDAHPRVVYYYYENEVELGPVTHAQMAELLHTKQVSPFQRIEKSVNGVREDFNPREFAT